MKLKTYNTYLKTTLNVPKLIMTVLNYDEKVLSLNGNMHEIFHATELLLSALRNEIIEAGETEEIADAIIDKIVLNAKIAKDFNNVRLNATPEEMNQEIFLISLLKNSAAEINGKEITVNRDYELLAENTKISNQYVRLNPNIKMD